MKRLASILLAAIALLVPAGAAAQFATITNGPSTTSACGSSPTFNLDKQNNVLSTCGTSRTLSVEETALAVFPAQTAVTSVTTAQTMASVALPGLAQNLVGRTLRVCGYGVYTSPGTSTPTITIQLTEGGITPIAVTSGAVSGTASTNAPFNFCFLVTTVSTGSAGTLEAHGALNMNIAANTPAAAMAVYGDTNTAVSSAINLQAANTLAIQVAASGTITSVTLRLATVEIVA